VTESRGTLLRQRNFRLLWTGETVSAGGSAMAVIGVPLLAVTALRASTFTVAALTAAAYLPWLVIGLPAGAWVDRHPARPMMAGCDVISALLYASLPAAAWAGMLTAGQVVAVALLGGSVNVVFATAYQVYLPALVQPAELTAGNARLQGGASAATIAGRAVAGMAAQALGAATALLFNAASFLVSAACLLRIRAPAPSPGRSGPRGAWPGLAFVARDPYLRPLSLYPAVANLAYTGNLALVVVFLIRVAGLTPAAAGLLMAAGGAGSLPGALLAPWLARTLGPARALVLTSLGTGLSGLLIPLTGRGPRMACYLTGAALIAAGIAVANVIAGSFRQEYCPPFLLGRVTVSMRFLAYGMIPPGALLAGALGTTLGVRNALWVLQALFAASGLILLTPRIRSGLPGHAQGRDRTAARLRHEREHVGRGGRDAADVERRRHRVRVGRDDLDVGQADGQVRRVGGQLVPDGGGGPGERAGRGAGVVPYHQVQVVVDVLRPGVIAVQHPRRVHLAP
jgi:predicted MFS family arabinose efflux permease